MLVPFQARLKGMFLQKAKTGKLFLFFFWDAVNKGRFRNNSKIDTLISKRLSVENKAKLSHLTWADFETIAQLTH